MSESKPEVNCQSVEHEIFELRDGVIDDVIRSHIVNCSRCRALAEWDRRFAESLRGEASVAPSILSAQIRSRVKTRRRLSTITYVTAATVLIAGVLSFWRPWNHEGQTIAELRGKSPAQSDDLAELPILFDAPPVDSLDVLGRQQNGYVVALRRMGEESK